MEQPLTYQQLLAKEYAENAKQMLADQQSMYYEDEYEVDVYQQPTIQHVILEDQHAFQEFPGARNTEEVISRTQTFEDKSKLSVRYNKDVKKNVFNIDSRFRSYVVPSFNVISSIIPPDALLNSFIETATSKSTHFVYKLSRLVKNAISIELTSFEMPNVFANYSTPRGNSQLRIKQSTDTTYQIINIAPNNPDGTPAPLYISTPTLLITYLQNALDGLGAPYTDITCSLNTEGFITLTNGGSTIFNIDFHSQPLVSPELFEQGGTQVFDPTYKYGKPQLFDTLGMTLGFPEMQDVTLSGSGTIIATHPPDLNTDDYIYLSINDYNTVIPQVVNDTFFTVFAKIPIQVDKCKMIFDTSSNNTTTKTYRFLQPTNVQQLEIQLLDMSGTEITFDSNFSMTIEIEEVVSHSLYEKMREM